MNPTHQQNDHHHVKRDMSCPPPVKMNMNMNRECHHHLIKKSSSSSSPSTAGHQQQRQPVIIYTHSPKVIHTHPRDFMALVQKLTGLNPSANADDINDSSDDSDSTPPMLHPNIPLFTPNSPDFSFYNYTDSLFFNPSISPSSTLDGIPHF